MFSFFCHYWKIFTRENRGKGQWRLLQDKRKYNWVFLFACFIRGFEKNFNNLLNCCSLKILMFYWQKAFIWFLYQYSNIWIWLLGKEKKMVEYEFSVKLDSRRRTPARMEVPRGPRNQISATATIYLLSINNLFIYISIYLLIIQKKTFFHLANPQFLKIIS